MTIHKHLHILMLAAYGALVAVALVLYTMLPAKAAVVHHHTAASFNPFAKHIPDYTGPKIVTPKVTPKPVQAVTPPAPPPPPPAPNYGGGVGSVPGVPSSFAACVAFRESTNGTNPAANGNVYGIIPASGYNVAGMSLAQQKVIFAQLYAQYGSQPWSPSDGC